MKCQPNMNDVQWFLLAATAQQSHVHIFIMDFRLLASFCFIVVRINVVGARRVCIELPHRWCAACFLWSGVHWNAVHQMKFILITIIWRFDCFKIWWTYLCMCESNETTHHIMNIFFWSPSTLSTPQYSQSIQ